jgi:hypothetical protein
MEMTDTIAAQTAFALADNTADIKLSFLIQSVPKKELYNGTPNVTVWRVLRKRLHLKAYKLYIVQALLETPCITSESHIEP